MKATNRTLFMIVLSVFLLGGMAACSKPKEPIKIGISAWAGVEPAELAYRKGFYEQRGVAVEMVRFSAYTDSIKAFREGRVDADMQTFDDAIRLFTAGRKIKVVLFTDYSYGGDGIVAKAGINSVADLKGKTVGVEIGTVSHLSLLKAMETVGLQEDDITIVSIPAWEIKKNFLAGKIDAGATWEPYLTSSAEEGGGQVIITSRDYPKAIVTTMALSDELIAKRRDDVQKIVSAYFDAVQFIKEHPHEAYTIMGQAEGISAEKFAQYVEGIRYIDLAGNKAAFGTAQDGELYSIGRELGAFLYKKRVIKSQPHIDDLLDGSFVNNIK